MNPPLYRADRDMFSGGKTSCRKSSVYLINIKLVWPALRGMFCLEVYFHIPPINVCLYRAIVNNLATVEFSAITFGNQYIFNKVNSETDLVFL